MTSRQAFVFLLVSSFLREKINSLQQNVKSMIFNCSKLLVKFFFSDILATFCRQLHFLQNFHWLIFPRTFAQYVYFEFIERLHRIKNKYSGKHALLFLI